jgi:hypothetical protein
VKYVEILALHFSIVFLVKLFEEKNVSASFAAADFSSHSLFAVTYDFSPKRLLILG